MKFWTLYWRTGKKQFLSGNTLSQAMTKAGYSQGAVPALDFYQEGFNFDYTWMGEAYEWQKTREPMQPREIQLDTMEVDGVKIKAFHMQPLLNEAHSMGHVIRVSVPEGGGPGIGWEEYFRHGLVYVHVDDLPALWEVKLG